MIVAFGVGFICGAFVAVLVMVCIALIIASEGWEIMRAQHNERTK